MLSGCFPSLVLGTVLLLWALMGLLECALGLSDFEFSPILTDGTCCLYKNFDHVEKGSNLCLSFVHRRALGILQVVQFCVEGQIVCMNVFLMYRVTGDSLSYVELIRVCMLFLKEL